MYTILFYTSFLQHAIQYKTGWNVPTELMLQTHWQLWLIHDKCFFDKFVIESKKQYFIFTSKRRI